MDDNKKKIPARDEVFSNHDLFEHIMRFVGPDHFFYTSLVSRVFRREPSRPTRSRLQMSDPPAWTKVAGESGDILFLGWCIEKTNFLRRRLVCAALANRGRLDLVKHALSLGCPMDKNTCFYAAIAGHLDVLKWLHSAGCPWDKWTVRIARAMGYDEVADWASANGCYE